MARRKVTQLPRSGVVDPARDYLLVTTNPAPGTPTSEKLEAGEAVRQSLSAATTDDLPEGSGSRYYTDERVAANPDVADNTAARHTHDNKSILDATTAPFTIPDSLKLAGVEVGAQVNDVLSVFGRTGPITAEAGDYTAGQISSTPAGGLAATTVQGALNELDTEKAPLSSPSFTGNPTAPTASLGTNSTQLATTAFVQAAVANLVNGAPGALDTLQELANSLGNDANFAATVTNSLAGKQPLDAELTALSSVTSAADKVPYFTGAGAAGVTDLTSYARTLLGSSNASSARTALGLGTAAVIADATLVHLSGSETITGAKTFNPGALLDKGNHVVDVRAYGAVGNGVADDTTAFQNAANAMAPGGIVWMPPGRYNLSNNVTSRYSGVRWLGAGIGVTVLVNSITTTTTSLGLLTFWHPDTVTPVKNCSVRNLSIDLNGSGSGIAAVNGIHIRSTSTAATISENFLIEDVEIYGRGIDGTGSIGAIKISGKYTGYQGSLRNIRINRVTIRDGVPTTSANRNGYSILLHTEDLETFSVTNSIFRNTYGRTIGRISTGTVIRGAKNWKISHNYFKNTMANDYFGDGTSDFADIYRSGFDGLSITNNEFDWDGDKSAGLRQYYHIAFYDSRNVVIDHNIFRNSMAIIAPGTSDGADENGNEDISWTFSNNLVSDAVQFGDLDGWYGGTVTNNIFRNIDIGPILGGYGRHQGSVYQENIFYNCVLNPQTDSEGHQALFNLQDGGNVVQNNLIINEVAPVKMKYVFHETSAGGYSGYASQPNVYRGNTIIGLEPTVRTFALDSDYKHIINGNTGLTETKIQNTYAHFAPSVTDLASSDVVIGNYRTNGDPVTNTTRFGAADFSGPISIAAGSITGITDLAVADGGTGASSATDARANLGAEAAITAGSTGQYWRGDKSWQTLDKAAVGLGNVPNVDATARAIHTGTQLANTISDFDSAADGRITAARGSANGIASLDSSGRVPVSQLPALAIAEYLGDFADLAAALAGSGVQASQRGDWFTVQTLGGQTYIVVADAPTTSSHVKLLATPTDAVSSVNGHTGVVTLVSSDVGLGNVTDNAQLKIASNLADLSSASAARTNLGLGSAALVADSSLMHLAGSETVTGAKTFNADITASASEIHLDNAKALYLQGVSTGWRFGRNIISPSTNNNISANRIQVVTTASSNEGFQVVNGTSATLEVGNVAGVVQTRANTQFTVAGNLTAVPATTKTATFTAGATEYMIACDASSGAITANLPALSGVLGRFYTIIKTDSTGNAVTLDGNISETINGATTLALAAQWQYVTVWATSGGWLVVSNN